MDDDIGSMILGRQPSETVQTPSIRSSPSPRRSVSAPELVSSNDLETSIATHQSLIRDLIPGTPSHQAYSHELAEMQGALAQNKKGNYLPDSGENTPVSPASTAPAQTDDPIGSMILGGSNAQPSQAAYPEPAQVRVEMNGVGNGMPQDPTRQADLAARETPLNNVLHGAASLADNVWNTVPSVVGSGVYALERAGGASVPFAKDGAETIAGWATDPFGKAFGIQNTPGYKNEASRQAMNWISQNVGLGADKISQKTGIPKDDVENMIGSLTAAAPGAVGGVWKGAKAAAGGVADVLKPSVEPIPIANRVDPTMSKPRLKLNADGTTTEIPEPTQSAQPPSPSQPVAPGQPSSPSQPSQYAGAGSTGANIIARLGTASEDLRADAMAQIADAQKTHGPEWGDHVNWDALDRHLNADSLPIPARLTQGQALQSGPLVSEEWNKRSTNGLGPMFVEQNQAKAANLQAIREQSAPDVNTNSPAEHAQTLMDAYGELHKQEKGVVDAKWSAIRETSSDKMIFDAQSMMDDAQSAIKKAKLSTYDPGGQLSELANGIKAGGFTADEYVAFRQNLGREAMKGGNEGAAASKIIESTNNSKLLPEAKQYQGMVNDALSTGKALHDKLANDPAYNAVAQGTASVKDFVNKFVVQGKPEKVANMTNNLVGNDVSQQTIRASLLDNLRDKAGLNDKYEGNFATKSFNKGVDFVTPNARNVFKNGELQTLRALGDYSSHTSYSGPDSYRNFSNTATELQTPGNAIISKAGGLAATGVETLLAAKTGGMSIPIISALKEGAKARAAARAAIEEQENAANYVHESTRPAAGLIKK